MLIKTFMPYVLRFFYPTALATAYGQRPKFIRAEHWAMAQHWTSCYRVSHDKMFFLKPLLESKMMASFGVVCNAISVRLWNFKDGGKIFGQKTIYSKEIIVFCEYRERQFVKNWA